MIVEMKFDLPEESEDYELYYHARDYYLALSEMHNELRRVWKYSDRKFVDLDKVWGRFHDILSEYRIEL